MNEQVACMCVCSVYVYQMNRTRQLYLYLYVKIENVHGLRSFTRLCWSLNTNFISLIRSLARPISFNHSLIQSLYADARKKYYNFIHTNAINNNRRVLLKTTSFPFSRASKTMHTGNCVYFAWSTQIFVIKKYKSRHLVKK